VNAPLEPELRRSLFRDLLRVRRVEERVVELYPEQEMRCPTHLSIGQEAVAVGVAAQLRRTDLSMSAHRSHAHYLCKGGDLRAMFAELYGKAAGCARGKGGSMHLIDLSVGFLGCVPIVGSTIPIAVGAAFGARLQRRDVVTVPFFGDGAAETGVLAESLNFAVLHRLPVLFVCENNLYSVMSPLEVRQPRGREIVDVARGLGVRAEQSDGQDVEGIYELVGEALAELRAGGGPTFLELKTYRWLEHCGPLSDLELGFRPQGEYERWTERCPLRIEQERLLGCGVLEASDVDTLEREIAAEIDDAVAFAKAAPFPERDQLGADVFAAGA
jgi:pyruvate dehydrogenase E1 component alpha subunit